jgi:hypothetical protein
VTLQKFDKWKIDFVGPINPPSKRSGERYIITTMEYLTRWVEAALVKDCSTETTSHFLFEQVITRFGCPRVLMSDQGTHFINSTICEMLEEFEVHCCPLVREAREDQGIKGRMRNSQKTQ